MSPEEIALDGLCIKAAICVETRSVGKKSPSTIPAVAGPMEVEPLLDPLPDGLWLMDTGCAQDLINGKLSIGIPIKTLTSSGRLIFSTANGRVASRNVVPVFCNFLL